MLLKYFGYIHYLYMFVTAAINVTKVIVNIPPSADDVIPFTLDLLDDNIVEPIDFYRLTITNISDPNVTLGTINSSFIIVNDDDEITEGKIYVHS